MQESLVLLDIEPSRNYFLSLFRDRGLEPQVGYCSRSLEMVRGFVGHGLGYSLLATKPANNMTYDDTTHPTWEGRERHRCPDMRPATRKADNLPG